MTLTHRRQLTESTSIGGEEHYVDTAVVDALEKQGVDTSFRRHFPVIPVLFGDDRTLRMPGDEVWVVSGKKHAFVTLKGISRLFTGNRRPPSFGHGPTKEYVSFFALIERTAFDFCTVTRRFETDDEFERLYRQLRRRPDGRDNNPLFGYIRAAARLYMSLRDTSQAEFEAVAQRLSQSARHFSLGPASTNYVRIVGANLS